MLKHEKGEKMFLKNKKKNKIRKNIRRLKIIKVKKSLKCWLIVGFKYFT